MSDIYLHGNAIKKHLRMQGYDIISARQRLMPSGFDIQVSVNLKFPQTIELVFKAIGEMIEFHGPYGHFHVRVSHIKNGESTIVDRYFTRDLPPEAPDNDLKNVPY